MNDKKFKITLESLLKKDARLVDENKELNLAAVKQLANKNDEQFITLLLSNDEVKRKFFLHLKEVIVFKQNDFKFFLDENKIDNSYTAYENRIGLSSNNRLLKDSGDVVLNFPYKDGVLEGGQSTEEGMDEYYKNNAATNNYETEKAQRKEIFFNEVIAKDEIDRLEAPKAFTHIKKYTAKGEEKIKTFTRDANGTITDNLIIKGNNLLALHSLKTEFTGKIKLIYIDPPYNTENDSFVYNDKFNHSTWLTFMRNRLEIAKELLREDGVIFISCDDNENAYLKVLSDEVFGRENFITNFVVVRSEGGGLAKHVVKGHDYLLAFAKSIKNFEPLKKPKDIRGKIIEKDKKKYWIEEDWLRKEFGKYGTCHYEEIEKIKGIEKKNEVDEEIKKGNYQLIKKSTGLHIVGRLRLIEEDGTKFYSILKHLNADGKKDLEDIGLGNAFSFPKPISLLKEIISGCTFFTKNEGDIILDFNAGSGTTGQAVLELNKDDKGNRQFIMVEQMDYVENVTVKRIARVIKNNKAGSFLFFEIKKWNEEAKEKIAVCKSLKELETLLHDLAEKYFLHYNVRFKEFEEKIIKEENFKKLPLQKQKEMFCKMLDLNQMYVNASEMEDKKYGLSKEDIALTKNFYNL